MTKKLSSLRDLEEITRSLENAVPSIKGSFPDFQRLTEEWLHYTKRCSFYTFGTIKSGKSTLANAVFGADLLPRGSGVKTFSRARVVHHERNYGRIIFHSPEQLTRNLTHDFRMLGCQAESPANPFAREGLNYLQSQFEAYIASSREDGRMQRIASRDQRYSLLGLAYARIERTLEGLRILLDNASPHDLGHIQQTGSLDFNAKQFDQFRAWLDVSAYAALIDDVEVGCPFPDSLPKDIEIVDCQGSDSLNPLDFASLDAVIHKTDQILYVINSRLGMRDGDARLLEHLCRRSAIDKLTLIINVEAYQPFDTPESNRIIGKTKDDVHHAIGDHGEPRTFVVNGLLELNTIIAPEEAERIQDTWRRAGCGDVLERHRQEFRRLLRDVLGQEYHREQAANAALPSLVAHAAKTAEALLGRDHDLLGLDTEQPGTTLTIGAFERIIKGENEAIAKDIAAETWKAFDRDAPLHEHLENFFKSASLSAAEDIDLSGMTSHGPIMAHASEHFHKAWMDLEAQLQHEVIDGLADRVKSLILKNLANLHGMLPTAVSNEVLTVVGPWAVDCEQFLNQMKLDLDHILSEIDRPAILQPVVLQQPIQNTLAAEFYARKFLGVISAKVTGKAGAPDPKRALRLWRRTVRAHYRQAREDSNFSVSSCRENLKFQYFCKLMDRILSRVLEAFRKSLDHHNRTFAQLAERSDILLTSQDRRQLQNYLSQIQESAMGNQ